MEYETSFSNPHRVFLDEELRTDRNISEGDPVELEFENQDKPLVVRCQDPSDLDLGHELYALIFSLHYCIDDIGTLHDNLFGEFSTSLIEERPSVSDSLLDFDGVSSYTTKVNHLIHHRIAHAEVIIGCGIADYLVKSNSEQDFYRISSPFAEHSKTAVSLSLTHDLPEITDIRRYDGNLVTPGDMYVCTYQFNPDEKQLEKLKNHILNDRYIMPGINYEYHNASVPAHGPLINREEDDEIYLATDDNIKFTRKRELVATLLTDEQFGLDELKEFLADTHEIETDLEYEIIFPDEDNVLVIRFEPGASILFRESDSGFDIDIVHPTKEDPDELEALIAGILVGINDELGIENEMGIKPHEPSKVLTSDYWVLDTNSIYRQKPEEDYNSISHFLLSNSSIYNKRIIIPWNVICEINKHKGSNSSRTRNASIRGVENLKILKEFDRIGLIKLQIQNIPDTIDNSIQENSGVTDLAILKQVPDGGVLLTSDDHLTQLSGLLDIHTESMENISGFGDPSHKEQHWDLFKNRLSEEGPMGYEDSLSVLESLRQEVTDDASSRDEQQIIQNKLNSDQLIEMVIDGARYVALSRHAKVIPTFSFINRLLDQVTEVDGETYLTGEALEKIRTAIGGIPTTYRPSITFLVPSEFIFRSSEIDQISALESLMTIKNCTFKTINLDVNGRISTDIEHAIIKASLEENSMILCTPDEDVRKYNLLGLDFRIAKLD